MSQSALSGTALVILGFTLACGEAPAPTQGALAPSLSKAARTTTYTYTLSGDIESPETSQYPAARATMNTGDPFTALSLSNVTVRLGIPTGDISKCRTGSADYAEDFGANGGETWTGSLNIVRKWNTLNFLGTRVGGTERLQFSISDGTDGGPQKIPGPNGSYSFAYTHAHHYSDSRTTDHDGLFRCVNLVVTATP